MPRGRIYYFVFDADTPAGGEKHSYQHVDILNAAGFEAYALHGQRGFRLAWFDNQTRVVDLATFWETYDKDRDYVVVPEVFGPHTLGVPGRKVIFNKNLYHGYERFRQSRSVVYPYADPKVVATFAVSDHNLRHLRCAFPQAQLFRMYAHIDGGLFAYRPPAAGRRRIACTAKARPPLSVLYHTLMARSAAGLNRLSEFEWTVLEGYTERQVAQVLQESLILISLSTHEGLPRTLLEGMACGCLVIGYGTGPVKECLPEEYRFEPDDFVSMVERVEALTAATPAALEPWTAVAENGRRLAEAFTLERQRAHLLEAWERIMS